jgi:nitrate reductase NapAB chaperone NapD
MKTPLQRNYRFIYSLGFRSRRIMASEEFVSLIKDFDMAEYIVKARSKREEKIIEAFLSSLDIDFHTQDQEDKALYIVMQKDRKTALLNKTEKESFVKQLKSAK